MSQRNRFERMVGELKSNAKVEVAEVSFGQPATASGIARAREVAKGSLPAGMEELYGEMNGFHLRWKIRVPALLENNDRDWGTIELLPLDRIFGDWQGSVWFDDLPDGDRYRPVRPFERFAPEACAALVQPPEKTVGATVHYHYFGEQLEDTGYPFPDYLDRLLASRGLFYWLETLCAKLQGAVETTAFRRKMPPKERATTAATPSTTSAFAACSREEPMPKLRPAITTSPGRTSAAKRGSIASRQWRASSAIGLFM